jgi:hypothetical protein
MHRMCCVEDKSSYTSRCMKGYMGTKLTSTHFFGGLWSAYRCGRFALEERACAVHRTGGNTTILHVVTKKSCAREIVSGRESFRRFSTRFSGSYAQGLSRITIEVGIDGFWSEILRIWIEDLHSSRCAYQSTCLCWSSHAKSL